MIYKLTSFALLATLLLGSFAQNTIGTTAFAPNMVDDLSLIHI